MSTRKTNTTKLSMNTGKWIPL